MGPVALALAFVVLLAAWRALSGGRVWPVAVATFLLGVVGLTIASGLQYLLAFARSPVAVVS